MIQATNQYVWVVLDEAERERGGLLIPDTAVQRPQQGTVKSVGVFVRDKSIKPGKKAIFNKNVGFPVEVEGVEYIVLRGGEHDSEILAVI